VRAIESRGVIESLKDRMTSENVPQPNLDALGEEFGIAFDRWVVQLVDWLRSPSRT